MKLPLICVFLLNIFVLSEPYRILGLFPLQSKSHMVMFERLMKGLAQKGHEVDVLSHFPQKNPVPRYNDISVRGTLPIFVNNLTVSFVRENLGNHLDMIKFMMTEAGVHACKAVLNSKPAKALKNTNQKYDLVITEIFGTDCMLGFAHHFKVPVVSVTSSVDLPWGAERIGNPDNPSYIPNYLVPYLSRMSLPERLVNTLVLIGAKIGYKVISTSTSNELARAFFGPDLPDLQDLIYNTSLILVNSHFSVNLARPIVPNLIEVGGLHIGPQKALSKHFESSLNVLDQYKGVIYLSTGSMILTETFPSYKLRAIFEAFRELPYKVMWKAAKENFLKDLDIPSNIQFEPWMPQVDLLCHPNVKLFVSHGGLMGTQEGVFCGVPVLGIPLFADQALNLKASEAMGLAIMVDYDHITKQSISSAARALLENPKYKTNAEKISRRFRDRPLSALDTAIYWVEYVIQHDGAPHLRTVGADLPWYQYFLVDVAAILIGALLILLTVVYCLLRYFLRLIGFRRKSKSKSKND